MTGSPDEAKPTDNEPLQRLRRELADVRDDEVTAELLAELRARYEAGRWLSQLARDLHVDQRRVRRLLVRAGATILPGAGRRGPRPSTRPPELLAELRRLYEEEHLSLRAIAERAASNPETVRQRLVDAGVTLRSKGSGRPRRGVGQPR